MSDPPGPAARIIPSDTPNRILRGARLATTTTCRPMRLSGEYAARIPANTVRSSSPTSTRISSSLSAPSTCFAPTTFAMRRSTFANSAMSILPPMSPSESSSAPGDGAPASPACSSAASFTPEDGASASSGSTESAAIASILFRSTLVSRGVKRIDLVVEQRRCDVRPIRARCNAGTMPRAPRCEANTGARKVMITRNRLMPTVQTSCTWWRVASSLTSTHGLRSSMYGSPDPRSP